MTSTIALIERLKEYATDWRARAMSTEVVEHAATELTTLLERLEKAEADLRGFKSARVAYFVTDAWGGYWQTQIDGIPYNFSTGNKRDQQKEIGRAERAEAQRDEAKVVEADALKRVDEWKARAELAESQRDTAIRERDELRMELESKYEDDAGASI